jgi:hypothetical protein
MAMIEKLVMFAVFMLIISALVWFQFKGGESHD